MFELMLGAVIQLEFRLVNTNIIPESNVVMCLATSNVNLLASSILALSSLIEFKVAIVCSFGSSSSFVAVCFWRFGFKGTCFLVAIIPPTPLNHFLDLLLIQ